MERWPHQIFALQEVPRLIESGRRKVCLTSPTGGGKTQITCDLIEWALSRGWKSVLYTNRRLLIDQLFNVLSSKGMEFGVRASGYRDQRELPVQISSLPTENARVLKSEKWDLHGADGNLLALIDEAHLNKSAVAQTVLERHYQAGGAYVGITATPIDLAHLYDDLVIAGNMTQLRDCKALVPAYHYGPDEPDMCTFKPNVKTGEYSEGAVVKAIMHRAIFGRVLDYYRIINPEQRPTILFGPGVQESIWFAQQLTEAGIRAAHIDGEGVWIDGEYSRTVDREEILNETRTGRIKVLCNRFVLREGLNLPEVSHLILATVMGSLQTYLQSAGRGLRACPGKDRLTIQDHGGHWWRHGSVNVDRIWELDYTESIIRGLREEAIREKREPEPIVCIKCGQVRISGPICKCGYTPKVRSRMVFQQDGTLREHRGDIFKPRRVEMRQDTATVWKRMVFRARNGDMTFRQAEGLFYRENGYYPPRDIAYMPTEARDWFRLVRSVPVSRLTWADAPEARPDPSEVQGRLFK